MPDPLTHKSIVVEIYFILRVLSKKLSGYFSPSVMVQLPLDFFLSEIISL